MSGLKKYFGKIVIIALIALGVLILCIMDYKDNVSLPVIKSGGNNEIELKIQAEASSRASFYTYNKNIYYCTKDGIQMINLNGETVWSSTYTMQTPYMTYDGPVVGVCEQGSKALRVYNQSGEMYTIEGDQNITSFAVNSSGYSSVITKTEAGHAVSVYDSAGERRLQNLTPLANGTPIATDLSSDNRIVAVSYLYTGDIKMESRVLFYYINQEDSQDIESADKMFASFIGQNQIIAIVRFMEGNNVVTVSESEIFCVEIEGDSANKYTEKWSMALKNEIQAIDFPENKYVAVAYGEPFINSAEPEKENTVKWYALTGGKVNEFYSEKAVDSIVSDYGATIIGAGRSFKAVNNKGGLIWEYNAIRDVNEIRFLDGTSKVLFVTPTEISVMNIRKKITQNEEAESESSTVSEAAVSESTEAVSVNQSETESETKFNIGDYIKNKINKDDDSKIEKATETTTAEKLEKNTESSIQKATNAPVQTTTEVPVQNTTVEPAETTTQAVTEKPVQTTTEKTAEPPTEKPNESVTVEPTTQKPEVNTQVPDGPVMPEEE